MTLRNRQPRGKCHAERQRDHVSKTATVIQGCLLTGYLLHSQVLATADSEIGSYLVVDVALGDHLVLVTAACRARMCAAQLRLLKWREGSSIMEMSLS